MYRLFSFFKKKFIKVNHRNTVYFLVVISSVKEVIIEENSLSKLERLDSLNKSTSKFFSFSSFLSLSILVFSNKLLFFPVPPSSVLPDGIFPRGW